MCNGLPKSVGPISTTRSVRDEFDGNLTLNFRSKSNLKEVLAGQDHLIRGKKHGICFVLRIGDKNIAKIRTHTLVR